MNKGMVVVGTIKGASGIENVTVRGIERIVKLTACRRGETDGVEFLTITHVFPSVYAYRKHDWASERLV